MKVIGKFKAGDKNKNEKGYALFIVLLVIAVVSLIAGAVSAKVMVDLNFAVHDDGMQKAFYIAEGGEAIASLLLSASNYKYFTHDTGLNPESSTDRLPITADLADIITVGTDGWYYWNWEPGDTHRSFTGSGKAEKFRFRAYPDSGGNLWTIDVEGSYDGKYVKRIQVKGLTDTAFKYALFGCQELSEFVRGADQTIDGKVHSNGNLYFRPTGTTLKIYSESVTAVGQMIRHKDAWDRPYSGGTVWIQKNSAGDLAEMKGSSDPAVAFGSSNADWLDAAKGALAKWGGRVIDGSLGAKRLAPPPLESIEEGGYYEQHANIVITSSINSSNSNSVVADKTFYNAAEGRYENYKEIDVSKITSYPGYSTLPSDEGGGLLIYSKVPVRLINAEVLPVKMTLVSNSNIYTQGDFNKMCGTQASQNAYLDAIITADQNGTLDSLNKFDYVTKKPAALITSQRIYHLSKSYSDSANTKGASIKTAGDPVTYTNTHTVFSNSYSNTTFNGLSSKAQSLVKSLKEDAGELEVYAALVDGTPTVDERNKRKEWMGEANPYYTGSDSPAWANSDDFLENWSSLTVIKRGSIVHMENANMAEFNNSDAAPGKAAWVVKTHYSPPTRDYGYDNDLSDSSQQPPSFFNISKRLTWKVVSGGNF